MKYPPLGVEEVELTHGWRNQRRIVRRRLSHCFNMPLDGGDDIIQTFRTHQIMIIVNVGSMGFPEGYLGEYFFPFGLRPGIEEE